MPLSLMDSVFDISAELFRPHRLLAGMAPVIAPSARYHNISPPIAPSLAARHHMLGRGLQPVTLFRGESISRGKLEAVA